MKTWITLALLALLQLCAVAPAQAQTLPHIFSNPRVLPGPQVPESLVLDLTWTGCGNWVADSFSVSVSNDVVTVRQTISGLDSQCTGLGGVQFSLGVFPPGSYTLVYQADEYFTGIGTYPALTTQFTVGGGAVPVAVNTSSRFGLFVLVLCLLVGLLRRRNSVLR